MPLGTTLTETKASSPEENGTTGKKKESMKDRDYLHELKEKANRAEYLRQLFDKLPALAKAWVVGRRELEEVKMAEKHAYTIHHAGLRQHNISVVTDRKPDENGLIVMTVKEYEDSIRVETPGDMDDWHVTTLNGVAVIHPEEIKFSDPRVQRALHSIKGELPENPEDKELKLEDVKEVNMKDGKSVAY